MKRELLYVIAGLYLMSNSVFADVNEFNISAHRMSLSGEISLPLTIDRQGRVKLEIDTAPSFSYFVLDRMELISSLRLSGQLSSSNFGDILPMVRWGLGLEGRYYFPINRVFLYTGIGYGFSLSGIEVFRNHLKVPFGILMPLGKNFAIDFGLPTEISFASTYYENLKIMNLHVMFRYFF